MNHSGTLPVWTRVGIAIAAIVFLQLFFIGNLPVRAEEAPADQAVTQETQQVQETTEPDTMGLPEFITETLAPLVQDEPVVEEPALVVDQPIVEETPVVEEAPVAEEVPAVEEVLTNNAEVSTDKDDYHPGERPKTEPASAAARLPELECDIVNSLMIN